MEYLKVTSPSGLSRVLDFVTSMGAEFYEHVSQEGRSGLLVLSEKSHVSVLWYSVIGGRDKIPHRLKGREYRSYYLMRIVSRSY